ncbi:hypothetical protein RB195_006144 [Necator americanus]|uniref:Neurotransmitter-gated ion-channel ligand-binding domain-containing protein n=1 Tax=Necator americanus TaxID=51031 RepID=A0ABR1BR66_NECAM
MYSTYAILFTLLNIATISSEKGELHYYDDPDNNNEERYQRDKNISYHNWVRQIEKDVLSKVSYKIAPYTDQQIDVQFIFHSVDHVTINEKEQVMSISGRYCMIWRDPHITWDPSKYNNLDTLHVGSYDVWTPRIIVLNGTSLFFYIFNGTMVGKTAITLITLITLTPVDLRTGRAGASNSSICPDRVPE